jgi:hypothetical protein
MSKFVLVDTISQYRMRYIIEVPDDHNEREYPCSADTWASDTVTAEEAKEFSQLWLGETIVSTREITKEQIVPLCDVDNEYCMAWNDDKKVEVFVTEIGYKKDW